MGQLTTNVVQNSHKYSKIKFIYLKYTLAYVYRETLGCVVEYQIQIGILRE